MRIREVDDFGAIARQRRRDLGLSQQTVAKRVGVTRQWLVRFEQGNPDVSLARAFAVLSELDLIVRAEAPRSSGNEISTPRTHFSIPTITMPELDVEGLRRSLERLSAVPTQQIISGARATMEKLDAARRASVTDDDD